MILRLEHIGIAVKHAADSDPLVARLLGQASYKREAVESEGVSTVFFNAGNVKVELLESTSENSAIAKFIERRGEGIHHLAFEVDNIEEEITRLKHEGFEFVSETPKDGADNKRICFLHPKTTNGVLIELCEEKKR